jgi:epoxyqueuosine reductase
MRYLPGCLSLECELRAQLSFAHNTTPADLNPRDDLHSPHLPALLALTSESFSAHFRNSPIKRTRRSGLRRNITVAMGNSGNQEYVQDLELAAQDDDPLVREHAQWALARLRERA